MMCPLLMMAWITKSVAVSIKETAELCACKKSECAWYMVDDARSGGKERCVVVDVAMSLDTIRCEMP